MECPTVIDPHNTAPVDSDDVLVSVDGGVRNTYQHISVLHNQLVLNVFLAKATSGARTAGSY